MKWNVDLLLFLELAISLVPAARAIPSLPSNHKSDAILESRADSPATPNVLTPGQKRAVILSTSDVSDADHPYKSFAIMAQLSFEQTATDPALNIQIGPMSVAPYFALIVREGAFIFPPKNQFVPPLDSCPYQFPGEGGSSRARRVTDTATATNRQLFDRHAGSGIITQIWQQFPYIAWGDQSIPHSSLSFVDSLLQHNLVMGPNWRSSCPDEDEVLREGQMLLATKATKISKLVDDIYYLTKLDMFHFKINLAPTYLIDTQPLPSISS